MADDEKMTVRERRAQHAKQQARKEAPKNLVRKAAAPAIIVLVLAGVGTGFYFTSNNAPDCPTHWHATFGVFVPGENASQPEEVSYRSARYEMGLMPPSAHVHQGDGINQFHLEGGCTAVRKAMSYVETRLTATSMELSGDHEDLGQAGKWRNNETATLRFFVEQARNVTRSGGAITAADYVWVEMSPGKALDYQLRDTEKLLVVFGDYTDDQVREMQARVPDPASRRGVATDSMPA